jgi:hypothetical protein
MQFNIFDKIPKFFNWFIDFIAKPLGIATWSIVLVLAGGYYGEIQREKAVLDSKERIKELETKVDTLSNAIINKDCSEEVKKYMDVLQTIRLQTSQNNDDIQKRLELEKQKTLELENFKQSLNLK